LTRSSDGYERAHTRVGRPEHTQSYVELRSQECIFSWRIDCAALPDVVEPHERAAAREQQRHPQAQPPGARRLGSGSHPSKVPRPEYSRYSWPPGGTPVPTESAEGRTPARRGSLHRSVRCLLSPGIGWPPNSSHSRPSPTFIPRGSAPLSEDPDSPGRRALARRGSQLVCRSNARNGGVEILRGMCVIVYPKMLVANRLSTSKLSELLHHASHRLRSIGYLGSRHGLKQKIYGQGVITSQWEEAVGERLAEGKDVRGG